MLLFTLCQPMVTSIVKSSCYKKKLINFLFLGTELEMDNLADDPPPFPTLDEMICGEFSMLTSA